MRRSHGYSTEFKKAAVEKLLTRGSRTVTDIVAEIGISSPTIYEWRDEFANISGMSKFTKPHSRPASEKFRVLMEHDALPPDKRGEYLRKNGIHEEHLSEWRQQIEEAFTPKKKSFKERQELAAEKNKVKQLEKEIRRKDKALAEVSALLVLKKKAELLWGTSGEEDE